MTLADAPIELRATTRPVEPLADPIGVFAAAQARELPASLWLQPDRGLAIVGVGRAWSVEAAGPGRFGVAAGRWRELAADLRRRDPSAAPILLGGLGFTGERPPADDVWAGFGASSLVMHELTWVVRPGTSTCTTVRAPGGDVLEPPTPTADAPVGSSAAYAAT